MPTSFSDSVTFSPWRAKSPKHTPPRPRRLTCTSARETCQGPGMRSDTSPNPHLPERRQLMSHPYVTKVTLLDGLIMLTLEFDKSMADLAFEISGYATQNGGAFANFYDVKTPTAAPDETVVAYIETAPLRPFKNGEDVTVVLRAARVWAAVLRQPE